MRQFQVGKMILYCGLALTLAAGLGALGYRLARAQDGGQDRQPNDPEAPLDRSNYIPVQGRLTDASGVPLDGIYDLTFRLYDALTEGTLLCEDDAITSITHGQFSTYMEGLGCEIDGRQLYLGIEVESDGEMIPRQYIDNVPYAWSLRPGAEIKYNLGTNAILDIENSASNGRGLRAYTTSETGTNYGIVGAARSPDGFGGFFYNTGGGTALHAYSDASGGVGLSGSAISGVGILAGSDSGIALRAEGTGIIQSTAPTYLWISGNGVRPAVSTDTTIITLDSIGGAKITRNAASGTRNVMLPITLPGTLYGQNVKVTGLDIYYVSQTEFDGFSAILLRRQTGVCSTCYASLLHNTATHICDDGDHATGCTLHFDLSTHNVLSASSGVLYLTLEMFFSGTNTYVEVGGVRLTLEYQP